MKRMTRIRVKNYPKFLFSVLFFIGGLTVPPLYAQVTIGSTTGPGRGVLLELKSRQADPRTNVTTDKGGLVLPRVALVATNTLEPFVPVTDEEWTNETKRAALMKSHAGLMVYNVAIVGASLYPAVYTWNGESWITSYPNPSRMVTVEEPKHFTFYETGEEIVQPLTFTISGAAGAVSYQWYQVTGSNIHVRISTPIGGAGTVSGSGATTASFTPTGVIKGTTRNAYNTGFYKFFCEVTDSYGQKIQSAIAEVAVGCGAKNSQGEWLSFMCFNLGAQNGITMAEQKAYPITPYTNAFDNEHTYVAGEENVYGDMFQWGRIPDGHEKRNSTVVSGYGISSSDIVIGKRCNATDWGRPYLQVAKTATTWYGKFIAAYNSNYTWNPYPDQVSLQKLWRNAGTVYNDACMHYKTDGTYQEFWHEGTDGSSAGTTACTNAGTGWRIPSQEEWNALYRDDADGGWVHSSTANSWAGYGVGSHTPFTSVFGLEARPDGETTTLFLPFTGHRSSDGRLMNLGLSATYWTSSQQGLYAHYVSVYPGEIFTKGVNGYAYGFSLRCIKNQ